MKKFSEYLKEHKFETEVFLLENFDDAKILALTAYKKIVTSIKNAPDAEEKKAILNAEMPKFVKILEKCLAVSSTTDDFFSEEEAKAFVKVLNITGNLSDRLAKYLSLSDPSTTKEEIEEWEKEVSLDASGTKETKSEEVEEDIPSESEPSKVKEEDDEDDIATFNADRLEREAKVEAARDAKAAKTPIKKVIVISDESIDGDPIRGMVGETSLTESSILDLGTKDDILSAESLKPFRSAKDLKRQIDKIKDSAKVKTFTFDVVASQNDEPNVWTVATI